MLSTTQRSLSVGHRVVHPSLRRSFRVQCSTQISEREHFTVSRRIPLLTGLLIGLNLNDVAFAAKIPKGYTIVQDKSDGYQYLAPFGWQEVDVEGFDSVYKVIRTDLKDLYSLRRI